MNGKLSDIQRREIINLYKEKGYSYVKLGEMYDVSPVTIGKIVNPNYSAGKLRGRQDRRRKLSDEDVSEIIKLYSTGNYSKAELSRLFNVSRTEIRYIVDEEYHEKVLIYLKRRSKAIVKDASIRKKSSEIDKRLREHKKLLAKNGELYNNQGLLCSPSKKRIYKIPDDIILKIYNMYVSGNTYKKIAEEFGISVSSVSRVLAKYRKEVVCNE